MKFKVYQEQLKQAVNVVNLAVGAKMSIPILSNMLFELNGENLVLTGTDLDGFIQYAMRVPSQLKGRFTAPAKRLKDIVASLPDSEVTLAYNPDSHRLNIEAQKTRFSINTMPVDEFPKIPVASRQKVITVPQDVLKGLVAKTIFAISIASASLPVPAIP